MRRKRRRSKRGRSESGRRENRNSTRSNCERRESRGKEGGVRDRSLFIGSTGSEKFKKRSHIFLHPVNSSSDTFVPRTKTGKNIHAPLRT